MPELESWRRVPPEERARQFMPFAALRGYYDLVEQAQHEPEPRRELSEESKAALDVQLARVGKGTLVRVTFHDGVSYVRVEGAVTQVDLVFRTITIVKRRIPLDDVAALELL